MGNQEVFNTLGFFWDRDCASISFPVHSVERACFRFHKMLAEYVWDASTLEGNPFTFPEVKTILDGVTVGGRKISDQEQVINLAKSSKFLLALVRDRKFTLDKPTFTSIHALVANGEALEWGHFRGEGSETNYTPTVSLGAEGSHYPIKTEGGAPVLNKLFETGVDVISKMDNVFERAAATFLFGALQQFFFDGNKRTSRFMMNGILMSAGIDAISIPAARAQEFNDLMVQFYVSKNAAPMMNFLADCHPECIQSTPGQSQNGSAAEHVPSERPRSR